MDVLERITPGETYGFRLRLDTGLEFKTTGRVVRTDITTPRGPAFEIVETETGQRRTFRPAWIVALRDNPKRPWVRLVDDPDVVTPPSDDVPMPRARRSTPPPVPDGTVPIRVPSRLWEYVTRPGPHPRDAVMVDAIERATFTRRGRWPDSGTYTIHAPADSVVDFRGMFRAMAEHAADKRDGDAARGVVASIDGVLS